MMIGSFFCGACFACVCTRDNKTDRKFIKEELKIITDALSLVRVEPDAIFEGDKSSEG